jgi:hypothetical protein
MIRSNTYQDLSDWIKQPIHTGSIYIKPTEERISICSKAGQALGKCFSYFHYIFCCVYIRSQ